ncbi:MAG: type II toxin-antitoxin system RelE family toxin [Anaerolineae bacterium]
MTESARRWRIRLSRQAEKLLERLPRDVRARMDRVVRSLADDPYPSASVRLESREGLYRIRVGGWRILYSVIEQELVVLAVRIAGRGSVYCDL